MGGGIKEEFKVNNLMTLPVPLPKSLKLDLSKDEKRYVSRR